MSQPIVLWNAKRRANHSFDDAGISIYKTILAPPVSQPPCIEQTNKLKTVPPLAYFCISALSPYPDQLHNLRRPVPYCEEVVRALVRPKVIPRQNQGTDFVERCDVFDVQSAHPRLWATLTQVMHPLPPEFTDYEVPLSDLYLPLLQQVPSRNNFCFVTLLALPGCNEVCDETISVLHRLNSLVALDLRATKIGSYGLTVLARSLSWSCDEPQTRTGLWGLRILRLHSCTDIDNKALLTLSKFPLLSSIDLRFTRCTPHGVSKYLANVGFMPSSNLTLFHPAPLEVSLSTLEHLLPSQEPGPCRSQSLYSCPVTSVYKLHVSKLNHRECLHGLGLSPHIGHTLYDKEWTSMMYPSEDSDKESNECSDEEWMSMLYPSDDSGRESNESSDENNDWPTPGPPLREFVDRTTSSIYVSRQSHREHRIRAAVVNSMGTDGDHLDPLMLARPPPPWSVLDAHGPPVRHQQTHDPQDKVTSIGHTRLTERHLASMQDMVTSLAVKNKKQKVGGEFASTSARPDPVSKTKNPFLRSSTSTSKLKSNRPGGVMRSVFAEQKAAITPVTATPRKGIANPMPKFCDARALKTTILASNLDNTGLEPLTMSSSHSNSYLPKTSRPVKRIPKPTAKAKQLRPITSYPVPPCPIEHLLLVPQLSMKRKKGIQTKLAFPGSRGPEDESDGGGKDNRVGDSRGNEEPAREVGVDRSAPSMRKKDGFDWNKWRLTTS